MRKYDPVTLGIFVSFAFGLLCILVAMGYGVHKIHECEDAGGVSVRGACIDKKVVIHP